MLDDSSQEFKGDWIPDGFQIKKVRRPKKKTPKWATSQATLAMHVLGREGRLRLRVAYLYWMAGLSAREIAESIKKPRKTIYNILYKLQTKVFRKE